MHEISIAKNILEIAEEYSNKVQQKKLKTIHLKIGEMSNVLVESLLFGFNSLIQNTQFEKAQLLIENIPIRLACKNCQEVAEIDNLYFRCEKCGSTEVEIISGTELEISKMEFEDL